jgi:hypothetical protein
MVVTRVELQQQLWKDGTFVDYEHGLNTAMSRLRQVLCDSAESPRYVETLPGRGYRFIADVCDSVRKPTAVVGPPPESEAEEFPPDRLRPSPSLRRNVKVWRLLATCTIAACLIAGFLLAPRSEQSSHAKEPPVHVMPPNGYALEAGSSRQVFALSPDGSQIAFTAMDSAVFFRLLFAGLIRRRPCRWPAVRARIQFSGLPTGGPFF